MASFREQLIPVGCWICFSWPVNRCWRCRRIQGHSRNHIPVSLVHFGHKAIATTRDGHDVAVRTRRFAEDLPQFPDRLRQVVLLNNRIGPNRLHNPLLIHDAVMVLDHVQERVEHSWRQRNRCSIQSPQEPFHRIELEGAEFVEVSRRSLHRGLRRTKKN